MAAVSMTGSGKRNEKELASKVFDAKSVDVGIGNDVGGRSGRELSIFL